MDQTGPLLAAAAEIQRSGEGAQVLPVLMRAIGRLGLGQFVFAVERAPDGARARITSPGAAALPEPEPDPFLAYCCNDFAPTPTGSVFLPDYQYLDEAARGFIARADALGMRGGVGLATRLRGPGSAMRGGFNLCGDLSRAEVERHVLPHADVLRHLCVMADRALDAQIGAILRRSAAARRPVAGLTGRELEVLETMRGGPSRGECAARLGCGHATVASHLRSAYAKLGARNLLEALRAMDEAARGARGGRD